MTALGRLVLAAALLLLCWNCAHADAYRSAGSLYRDCAAGSRDGFAAAQRHRRCADYIDRLFNNWNLNQDNGICSKHVGDELPRAYVEYWRAKHVGFWWGEFTSAQTSVNEFLDSQRQPCPVPDPKTHPP